MWRKTCLRISPSHTHSLRICISQLYPLGCEPGAAQSSGSLLAAEERGALLPSSSSLTQTHPYPLPHTLCIWHCLIPLPNLFPVLACLFSEWERFWGQAPRSRANVDGFCCQALLTEGYASGWKTSVPLVATLHIQCLITALMQPKKRLVWSNVILET